MKVWSILFLLGVGAAHHAPETDIDHPPSPKGGRTRWRLRPHPYAALSATRVVYSPIHSLSPAPHVGKSGGRLVCVDRSPARCEPSMRMRC
jgi:hypothetical protein